MRQSTPKAPDSSSSQPLLLKPQLNPSHPLVKLAEAMDWSYFEQELQSQTAGDMGRPQLPTRLLVGLHYLKAMYDESDESVVMKWVENPYWQYFCGESYFQHELPCHPTTLVKWRKRIGSSGMEKLLKQVLKTANGQQALERVDLKQVNVDTTVQEKVIAFPTDARLYDKARRALVRQAKQHQVKLRQSYVRLGKQALLKQSRYATVRQGRRAQKQTQKLRTYLGRVIRDLERKLSVPSQALATLLESAKQIDTQQKQDTHKCYSVHAPEVECIAKGKANKKYEFGCKVAVVTTSSSNWIVGIAAHHGNPYDGATLAPALAQVEQLTGVRPQQAIVDQGFRGTQYHPDDVDVLVCTRSKRSGYLKRILKRRNAIEPVIGHSKADHGMGRNYLKGQQGDQINALLAGCGFNLRKLCRFLVETTRS